MLSTRIVLGAAIVLLVVGALGLDVYLAEVLGSDYAPGFYLLLVLIMVVTMSEFYQLLRQSGRASHPGFGIVFALLLLAWEFGLRHFSGRLPEMLNRGVPLAVAVALVFVLFLVEIRKAELRGGPGPALESIAWTMLGFAYIALPCIFIIEIRFLASPPAWRATQVLVLALGTIKVCDIGGYAIGRPFGKHKVTPVLSPGKTVEGTLGGIIFGTAFALLFGSACLGFGWWPLVVFGITVSVASQAGDLAASLIKRACRAKNSGRLVGFGGVLDLLDSILLGMPVAYLLLVLLTPASR